MRCCDCRYSVDVSVDKTVVNKDVFSEPSKKRKAVREVKAKFEERSVMALAVAMFDEHKPESLVSVDTRREKTGGFFRSCGSRCIIM